MGPFLKRDLIASSAVTGRRSINYTTHLGISMSEAPEEKRVSMFMNCNAKIE
jgi:hypothetical protein